jgi:hypothetical protein
MKDRSAHCCLCGAPRRPTQKPVESFGNDIRIVQMADHRPMLEGRWEDSPQLLVNVSMWRNGGTAPGQTHICDDCLIVGLKHAKHFVDASLAALMTPQTPKTTINPDTNHDR